jgi:hypothetical protein
MVPPAELLENRRLELPGGLIIQIRIWQLPVRSGERPHGLKYSLFFGRSGERIIGYDNEVGKGDHRHYRQREEPYLFVTMEKLVADFWSDVRKEIGHE